MIFNFVLQFGFRVKEMVHKLCMNEKNKKEKAVTLTTEIIEINNFVIDAEIKCLNYYMRLR